MTKGIQFEDIKGIEGRDKEYPKMVCFTASHDPSWTRTYHTLRTRREHERKKRGFNTDADWFLIMNDGTKYPLPDLEAMDKMEKEVDQMRRDFWSKKLNNPK